MRRTVWSCLFVWLLAMGLVCGVSAQTAPHPGVSWDLGQGRLGASAEGHDLMLDGDRRFLWIGDTVWELFHRYTREEAEEYLENRRAKGFTVIQAVALAELGGFTTPNSYGHLPFVGVDPERPAVGPGPDDDYWDHVDYIVDRAGAKGMFVGLLPTWGEWVTPRFGTAYFTTPEQGYAYGWFLGNRYRTRGNILWILGGDREPVEAPRGFEIWRAMAEGIADGVNDVRAHDGQADYGTTFMTYHAFKSSSTWFHNDPWIDAHMWGTYHFRRNDPRSFRGVEADRGLPHPKPTINGEPPYEDHPIDWKPENGWFDDYDVRQAAYWTFLSGGAGFTYGAHPVWQKYEGQPDPPSPARTHWREALDLPGARAMLHLRRLLLSRRFPALRPDPSLIPGEQADSMAILAARGDDYAIVYIPDGRDFDVRMGILSGRSIRSWWFEPRTGMVLQSRTVPNEGVQRFSPPGPSGRGQDRVLVLDDAGARYGPPGALLRRRQAGGRN